MSLRNDHSKTLDLGSWLEQMIADTTNVDDFLKCGARIMRLKLPQDLDPTRLHKAYGDRCAAILNEMGLIHRQDFEMNHEAQYDEVRRYLAARKREYDTHHYGGTSRAELVLLSTHQ